MPIAFSCPGCAKRYEVSDSLAGKSGRCKQCGGQFTIPVPSHLRAPAPATSPSRPAQTAAAPPPRPRPAPAPEPAPPVAGLGAFDEDLFGEVPLADSNGPRTSRYRAEAEDDFDEDDVLPETSAQKPKKQKKKKKSGGGAIAEMPLPMLIMVGGNLMLLLFLAFVVWPSMQGGGGGGAGAANAGEAPPAGAGVAPPPAAAVGQLDNPLPAADLPPSAPADPQPAPAVVNGFPALPAPAQYAYPAGTPKPATPPVSDLSQHEQTVRENLGLMNQLADALATMRDEASARAAADRIQGIVQQAQAAQRRGQALPNLQPHEEAELFRRLAPEIKSALDRLQAEIDRLSRIPGAGLGAAQMRMSLGMMSGQLQAKVAMSRNAGPQPFVEVYVAGVPDADTSAYVESKLRELADVQPGMVQAAWSPSVRASAFRVSPAENPQTLAIRIPFGQARVSGYKLTVESPKIDSAELAEFRTRRAEEQARQAEQAALAARRNQPDPEAPAGADEITQAIFKLKSSNGFTQKEGLDKLAKMLPKEDRRDEVVDAVEPVATSGEHLTGPPAVQALANWGGPKAEELLVKLLKSNEHWTRSEAIKQVGRLQIAAAAEPLAELITEEWTIVPDALRALGPAAEPVLIRLLKSPDSDTRKAAVQVLGDIGGKDTLDAMKKLPADPDTFVRMEAQKAMRAIDTRVRVKGDE